jgi:ribosome-associated protein
VHYKDSDLLTVNQRVWIPLAEVQITHSRSSGPGGQNVNKVNTKVTLRWAIATNQSLPEDVRRRFTGRYRTRINGDGVLVLHSQRFRSQSRNHSDCLEKLSEMLSSVAHRPTPRKPTKPSRASVRRRLDSKKKKSVRKQQRRKPNLDD